MLSPAQVWKRTWRACLGLLFGACLAEAGARLEADISGLLHRPPSGAFELYVVGESTPAGVPFGREFAFPALAVQALGERLAGRPVAVVSLARGGESIYPQAFAFERALHFRRRNPGAVVIYSGNNDAENLPGEGSHERLREKLLEHSILLSDLYYLAVRGEFLRDVRTEETYSYNLRRIVESSLAEGLTPILFTVPSNLTGVDPGLFREYVTQSREDISDFLRLGREKEASGRIDTAIRFYRQAGEESPGLMPYASFLIAGCYARQGRRDEAQRYYKIARDTASADSFGRARSQQNALIRRLATEFNVPLVDAEALFESRARNGIPGDDLFGDAHHPNLEGVALLTDALADELTVRYGNAVSPAGTAGRPALDADRATRVKGLVYSGRWLFTVACRHLAPGHRLDLAESRFKAALELSPDEFSAELGLCLVNAARRHPELIMEPAETDWLSEHGLLYGDRFELSAASFAAVASKLRALGVPENLVRRAERAYRPSELARRL